MPLVLRFNKVRVLIFHHDHKPPHVHCMMAGAHAKFMIENGECYYSRGFSEKDLGILERFVKEHKVILEEKWEEINEKKH